MHLQEPYFQELINTIALYSDYNFNLYSTDSLYRRIEKALDKFKITISDLIQKIKSDTTFLETLVEYITVNTTEFYRDKATWEQYEQFINNNFKYQKEINIWHIGCSTGLEVYSNLILLNDYGLLPKTNIYATDINADVLKIAEQGIYQYIDIKEFKSNYNHIMTYSDSTNHHNISKYFRINENKQLVKVKPILLNRVKYQKHDILSKQNPFNTKFDIIFSCNVLMYFKRDIQEQLYGFLYENLQDNGCLITSRYETIISNISQKFEKQGVFYRKMTNEELDTDLIIK